MYNKYLPFLIYFIIFSFNIYAQDNNPIDKELSECMDKNPSTQGNIQCIDKAYEKWDKQLNDYYQKLLDKLDDKADEKLKEAQRKWIEFRDLEFTNIESIYSYKDGTMYLPMLALDKMEIVKKRAIELKSYYEILMEY
ncbi:MAG: DUF1311 domain-containing protein [Ignavibacteriae bacterium]|nr:MAG: DUF1311 domain-containing protein [Ignavibacteriota bacterium]